MAVMVNFDPSKTIVDNKFEVLGELAGDANLANSEDLPNEETGFNNVIVGTGSTDRAFGVESNVDDSCCFGDGKVCITASVPDLLNPALPDDSDQCGPLRARLAWNFINNPDSLAHKLIDAKYGSDIWENQGRCNMSTAWKILKIGARLLWPFLRWRISSGESINTVNDIWLLNRNLCSWPTYAAQMDESSNLLSGFIKNGAWDVVKLNQFFGSDLVKSICSTKIYSDKDKMELIYKCSGRSLSSLILDSSFFELSEDLVWYKMKKLRLRPRVEFFWWKLRLNVIPSNSFLRQRKLVDCSDCPRGCGCLEDVDHVSVKCNKIHSILKFLAGWGCNLPSFSDLSDCIKFLISLASSNPFIGNLYCSIVFLCWKSRNNLSHGGRDDSSLVLATNAFCMAVASFNCNLTLEN
ncbi:hypothetical protein M5K25_008364 [Dendrobium thyrsiflorum]|uniref:Reverse transcriptase zinc-binding domain-containing protein n=1 Tax=Dendrobium thyrsiflorum TaxID=117978 RepID=A0ABD0V911_DENTH